MAEGILGIGSSGSSSLNQELINDLKEKEYEAVVSPLETELEDIEKETEIIDEIELKTLELLETIKPFDLYVLDQNNVFDEVSADVSGTSAIFDAADTSNLSPGTTYVEINQLAQKDVYQSNKISQSSDEIISTGQNAEDKLIIEVDGHTFEFVTLDKTYEELVYDINTLSSNKLVASIENVSDDEFRFVIKSAETGLANSINITQSDGLDFGFNAPENHTLKSQNMHTVIDGVEYNTSSNVIVTQGGLSISGVELGSSTISIKKDTSLVYEAVYTMANQYNELNMLINDAIYSEDTPVEDKATLRIIQNDIKQIMFGSYGLENEESLFIYGISFDTSGYIQINQEEFNKALAENPDDLEELFVGYAEKEGIGTRLKTYLDTLDGFDGLLYTYEENMNDRKTELEEEKEKAVERLDTKYAQMEQEFADATVLITQMENEFASLQAIINSESSS